MVQKADTDILVRNFGKYCPIVEIYHRRGQNKIRNKVTIKYPTIPQTRLTTLWNIGNQAQPEIGVIVFNDKF